MENSLSSSSHESSSSGLLSENDSNASLQVGKSEDILGKTLQHQAWDSEFAQQVQSWVLQVPIGMGLCPWAGKSHRAGNLRYVTCSSKLPEQVMEVVYKQMEMLLSVGREKDEFDKSKYSTTLLICPFVKEWVDFDSFEKFVNNRCVVSTSQVEHQDKIQHYKDLHQEFQNKITLVPFHPKFLRWRSLPEGIGVGTVVESHWGMVGSKTATRATATIIETENKVFGKQKVKIRFHEELEGRRSEQYVPIDWILVSEKLGLPLPDNCMHRAPYPTIHLISNLDLASLSMRDISRVKRKNARRMMNFA